jgi:hypothetical protein
MIPIESSRASIGADEKSSGFLEYPNRNNCRFDFVETSDSVRSPLGRRHWNHFAYGCSQLGGR